MGVQESIARFAALVGKSPADPYLHLNGHIVGGAFRAFYEAVPAAVRLQVFGLPTTDEMQAQVTDVSPDGVDDHGVTRERTVQYFERAIVIYEPENSSGWQVVCATLLQLIGT